MEWQAIVPNLVGGGITAGTAASLFFIARSFDKSSKSAERHKLAALRALTSIQKFTVTVQEVLNLDRVLDRQFQEAYDNQTPSIQPAEIVGRFIRPARAVDRVTIEDVAFLFPQNAELYEQINIIQQNQEFNLIRLAQFNAERKELEILRMEVGFLLDAENVEKGSPRLIAFQRQYSERISFLNVLLGSIIESLARDKKQAMSALEKLVKLSKEKFGDALVIRNIELRGADKC